MNNLYSHFANMVLHKPENKHVLKAFDLHGKVAAVTGMALDLELVDTDTF